MTRLDSIAAQARSLLPPYVHVAVEDPRAAGLAARTLANEAPDTENTGPTDGLLPVEAAAISAAVPRRRGEFAAGRRAARRAMAALGHPPAAIPMGPDRAPVWPDGLVGSISHTADCCIAVVTPTGPVAALGIDLEPDLPLETGLWDSICTRAELEALQACASAERGRLVRRIFAAKEAVYKAQYPLTGALIGFDAVTIDGLILAQSQIHGTGLSFRADLVLPNRPSVFLYGKIAIVTGMTVATVTIRAGDNLLG